jgi:hypothetical protein
VAAASWKTAKAVEDHSRKGARRRPALMDARDIRRNLAVTPSTIFPAGKAGHHRPTAYINSGFLAPGMGFPGPVPRISTEKTLMCEVLGNVQSFG